MAEDDAMTDIQFDENGSLLVAFLLNSCESKLPIKATDIQEVVNRNQEIYKSCLPLAQESLRKVYGIVLMEVPESKAGKKYICCSEIRAHSLEEYDDDQKHQLTLLFLILSYIFMSGGTLEEDILFDFLNHLEVHIEEDHNYFGKSLKKLITETFVRQLYLKKEKIASELSANANIVYSWGYRSTVEFDKKDVLEAVAQLLGRPASMFVAQQVIANDEQPNP